MASLDSANGPSVTMCLLVSVLPAAARGPPLLNLPSLFNCSNHAVNRFMPSSISPGVRSWYQALFRNNNRYSEAIRFSLIVLSLAGNVGLITIRRTKLGDLDIVSPE